MQKYKDVCAGECVLSCMHSIHEFAYSLYSPQLDNVFLLFKEYNAENTGAIMTIFNTIYLLLL